MWKNVVNLFKKDNLYQQALQQAYAMLDADWLMYEASVESLRQSDTGEIKIDIFAKDKEVNAHERDVRKKVLTHLALSGGAELTSGLILVSVVTDIERIGDYTKNIYDLSRQHPKRLHGGRLESLLQKVEVGVTRIFEETIQAFKTSDEGMARAIMADYKQELAIACDTITNAVVSGKVTDLGGSDAAALALYARYLKRIAAHSRNIISSVVNPFPRLGYKEKPPEQ
ncbi:MAG TPA: PhoU domain-containing protein [Candidatus Paceibacterota bacterium]|nr:PhoU domain-containing protein [Candidatus Paceibacterota bacterium]